MLYVIQVRAGSENAVIRECKAKISTKVLTDVYVPTREERIKVQGKWTKKQRVLFPGYVFVESDEVKELYHQLQLVERFTRFISVDREPLTVTQDEMQLIDRLVNSEHVMEVSEGIIEGSMVVIRRGPLKGLEGMITKINRHKRKAWIETSMFGRMQVIEVGLEITSKT